MVIGRECLQNVAGYEHFSVPGFPQQIMGQFVTE